VLGRWGSDRSVTACWGSNYLDVTLKVISTQRPDLTEENEFAVPQMGFLAGALVGADVFIGVSVPGVLTPEMVRSMAKDRIIFAMANPIPEIQRN